MLGRNGMVSGYRHWRLLSLPLNTMQLSGNPRTSGLGH
jgi:hypothetical protein